MDQPPNLNIENDQKTEKRKFKATIVDTTDLMQDQAIDVGNEKMTMKAIETTDRA